jgi:hypothetical protein
VKILKHLCLALALTGCSQAVSESMAVEEIVELEILGIGEKDGERAAVVRYNNELQSVILDEPFQKGEFITVNVFSNQTLELVN